MILLTKEEKIAIITVINLVNQICDDTPTGGCPDCPFWTYCEHSNETPGNYLDNIFEKLLDK